MRTMSSDFLCTCSVLVSQYWRFSQLGPQPRRDEPASMALPPAAEATWGRWAVASRWEHILEGAETMGHHQPVSSGESSESFVSDVQGHLGSLLLTFDATAVVVPNKPCWFKGIVSHKVYMYLHVYTCLVWNFDQEPFIPNLRRTCHILSRSQVAQSCWQAKVVAFLLRRIKLTATSLWNTPTRRWDDLVTLWYLIAAS